MQWSVERATTERAAYDNRLKAAFDVLNLDSKIESESP